MPYVVTEAGHGREWHHIWRRRTPVVQEVSHLLGPCSKGAGAPVHLAFLPTGKPQGKATC